MRIDHQTQSLHYFHSFAVKDRVNFSSLPNTISLINPPDIDLQCFLPTADDQLVLEENLCVLISRMVVQYIPFFRRCTSKVKQHIDHPYSRKWHESQLWYEHKSEGGIGHRSCSGCYLCMCVYEGGRTRSQTLSHL